MKLYFLIVIIFISLYTQRNLIEPVILSCCGGMSMSKGDYKETDTKPPKRWKRCFKPNEWDSFPCTSSVSSKCCNGEGKCRPSKYGGKCEKNDRDEPEKFFILDEDGIIIDYTNELEEKDKKEYKDDEDDEGEDDIDDDDSNVIFYICLSILFILAGFLVWKFVFSGDLKKNKKIIGNEKTYTDPYKYESYTDPYEY